MSLVAVVEARAQVKTSLTDEQLQAVIDRVEDEVIRLAGPHYVDGSTTVTETLEGGLATLYLRRPLSSVASITEAGATLAASEYKVLAGAGMIRRLGQSTWGDEVTVVYIPADDNLTRKQVIIELVRLDVERTAMRHESVAGEYSYDAPEWEVERAALLRRLQMWF